MIYIGCSILMAVVAYIAYTQGHIDGENKGRMDVLREDEIRDANKTACMDETTMDIINNLMADEERAQLNAKLVKGNQI